MTASAQLLAVALLQRLAEQAYQSGAAVPADLKTSWRDLERRLLLGLRAEEREASPAGTDPLRELKAIGSNERIRNLVWEVSISLELQSPNASAMLKLAELLRARALAQPSYLEANRVGERDTQGHTLPSGPAWLTALY